MIEKIKGSRVSNSTNTNRSLSKRHAARVMRQIKRGQSGGQKRSILSESTLSKDQSSINQNMFQMLTPAQQQMLLRHKHNFVMDVQPKSSKSFQNKKKRMKFSEYTKQKSGNNGGSLIDDNSHQGSGFGYSSSQFFTGHRTGGGRVSSLNFQPRTSPNIQGLNATSQDSLSLSNANLQQQFAPSIGKKENNKGSPKILQPQFIGQSRSSQKKRKDRQQVNLIYLQVIRQFQGTQVQTAGWAESQQQPQIETPQSHLKSSGGGSIFKNQDVYLYKDDKQLTDNKKNYLVVQIKQQKTQQRSPTAQLINLKTARAQAKRELSKIGAMEDYNVLPVTKIVQSKDKKSSQIKNSGGTPSSNSKMAKKLKKYSPVRGDNLIKSLREIQQLESPKPLRSTSLHKRMVMNSSQSKMKKINQQSEAETTPPNQLQNRNLVEEFKAVASVEDISEEQKIDRLIAQNSRYLQEQQREEQEIKLKLDQKFSEIQEEIFEYENSPQKVRKIQQSMGQQQVVQSSESEPRMKLAAQPPALTVISRKQILPLQTNNNEKNKTWRLIEDPIFEPAKEILQEIAHDQEVFKINKMAQSSGLQNDKYAMSGKDYLQHSQPLKIEDLQVSSCKSDISAVQIRVIRPTSATPKNFLFIENMDPQKVQELQESFNKSDISAVQIKIIRPRQATPENFLLLQDEQEKAQNQHDLPEKIETPKNKQQPQTQKGFQKAEIQTKILSPHSQKINQYKRIIQVNQREPQTPPPEERLRHSRLFRYQEEQSNAFGLRKESSSSSVVRQQATQDIIHRIRSARDARNEAATRKTKLLPASYYSESIQANNDSKFQRSKTPLYREEKRLDPDLQQSLRQISRKSIVLKNADIIKNQYQVDEQKHLQELEKTLCAHEPVPQVDQTHQFLQTSQTNSSNKHNNNNLRDSLLTLNQLSVEKQTPTSTAYFYKRHMKPGCIKSDTADPTASFGLGVSRISDQFSNLPKKMVTSDTFILGQQDISIAQQNLQLRSAFKQKLKDSGDKKRLTKQISQACYKEVEKLIQQERREDQLRGMRKKSKYVEVKSKVKDYIQGRSFSRQYQKISDISALTQSSMRKTPVQDSASNQASNSQAARQFLLQRSKSPKIVRQFHLSSTAAISSPNSSRRTGKKSKLGSISESAKNLPDITHQEKQNIQKQEFKSDQSAFQIPIENANQINGEVQSHHASGEILLPTIYTSTQNQSLRVQSSNPSSASRRIKAQKKKKEALMEKDKESNEIFKASPTQRQNKYLYQQLNAQYNDQQYFKREQRDFKKQQLLQKIEKISNEIKEKTHDSNLHSQNLPFLTQSFSYQSLRKNVPKDKTNKNKIGSRLVAHTQTSRAKIASRQEIKKPYVPRIRGLKNDGESTYALHTSYNSVPSSASSRVNYKKSSARGGVNYFHNKSTLTKKDQGNWQINTHNRQLLSPELIQNLTLQSQMNRQEAINTPQTIYETKVSERSVINITPSASSICSPRGHTTANVSKKQAPIITKVKKIQQFSSRPINLSTKTQEILSPLASSIAKSKNSSNLLNSNTSIALKQKSRSTPKLQFYKNQKTNSQQPMANQNLRNNNQSNRNRQPMQRKVTITTTHDASLTQRPHTTRNSTKKTTFSNSKAFSGIRKSQDDIFKHQNQVKVVHTPRNQISSNQIQINQENKTDLEGSGSKSFKKKWLSKQMEREKQKMAKSYHKIIATSTGISSRSLTNQQWSRLKVKTPVQVIYESTQQSA